MAYATADVVDAIAKQGGPRLEFLRVDGGGSSNDWLMQFQADLLGLPIDRPEMLESTALGAAALAGLETGVWRSPAALLEARRFHRFDPRPVREEFGRYLAGWRRAVSTTLHWANYGERANEVTSERTS